MIYKILKIFNLILLLFCIGLNIYFLFTTDFINFYPNSIKTSLLWLISIALWLILFWQQYYRNYRKNNTKINPQTPIYILSILIFAFFIRFQNLKTRALYPDEKYWIEQAQQILSQKVGTPFGFIGDQPSNLPAFPVAVIFAITHNPYLAARLPGIVYSLFAVLYIFLIVKKIGSFHQACFAALIASTSIWDIHNSTLGWNNITINTFLIPAFIYHFAASTQLPYSKFHLLATGIILGISTNLLYVALLFIPVTLFINILRLINKQKEVFTHTLIIIITLFIFSYPTIVKIIKSPESSIARHKNFVRENFEKAISYNVDNFYLGQFAEVLADFQLGGEKKYNDRGLWGISLDPLILISLIIGMFILLLRKSDNFTKTILLTWFVMFVPVVFLNRLSSVFREYYFYPTTTMIASFGLWRLIKIITPLKYKNRPDKIFIISLIIFFGYWIQYYHQYRTSQYKNSHGIEESCRIVSEEVKKKFPPLSHIYIRSESICLSLLPLYVPDYSILPFSDYYNQPKIKNVDSFYLKFPDENIDTHILGIDSESNNFVSPVDGFIHGSYYKL